MTRARLPRLRTLALPVTAALTTVMATGAQARAEDIEPMGIGDLMPSPTTTAPKGGGTLYETYSGQALWLLDTDFGTWDTIDPMLHAFADICMMLLSTIGIACVVAVQWVFQMTSLPEMEEAITDSLSGSAGVLGATILPSALAVGMLVAWTQGKDSGGGGISQIMWVMVSGVVSISLLSTPQAWVSGVDTFRTVGSEITMEAASAGVGGSEEFPFKLDHEPKFTDNARDTTLRRSADSIWRSYVATPWCIAEFGSLQVCEKYGKDLLDQGTDPEKRKEWLQENVTADAVGEESVSWRQGHQPLMRFTVTSLGLLSILIFAFLLLMLAFASLASLLGAFMLLISGVFFASLWVIPGKPRQWGNRWFDQLLSRCLESVIATLVLGAILAVQTASTAMFPAYGWLPTTGLSIAAAVVALKFRGVVAQIIGVSAAAPAASTLGGVLAYRAISKAAGRIGGGGGGEFRRRPGLPGPGTGGGNGGGGGGAGPGGELVPRTPGPGTFRPPAPGPDPEPVTITVVRPTPPPPSSAGAMALPQPRTPALTAGTTTATLDRPAIAPARMAPAWPGLTGSSTPRPEPVLRPEKTATADAGAYAFRHIPPPTPPSTAVIQGEVLARADTPRPAYQQPALDGTLPPSPASRPRRPATAPATGGRRPAPPARQPQLPPPPAPRPPAGA
ncbi:hypothetical protein ABT007_27710 [Streptomyces griseus]|uniref:hypothetical protein n=1 Tax=Streptomyces griseus TaxID=1911 RepID=UPI00331E436C